MTNELTAPRLDILNSPIPFGGKGRTLTSTELKALRTHGYKCSTGWTVVRTGGDADWIGAAYRPHRRCGGFSSVGLVLTWETSV
jgi:hypothetical protein